MKKLLPALLMLSVTATAQAQTKNFLNEKWGRNHNNMEALMQNARSANKTTATYWRIAAVSNYQSSGTSLEINDSSKYVYSNGRGSTIDMEELFIDDYGVNNRIMYDTVWKFADNGSGLENQEKYYCTYTGSNQKQKFTQQYQSGGQGFENTNEIRATRDGNGNLTKEENYNWNGMNNTWELSGVFDRVFDGQNKIILDSFYNVSGGSTMPGNVTKYIYDGNGYLTNSIELMANGGSFDSNYQYINTHYAGGKVKTTIAQQYINGAWHNQYYDSMGYGNTDLYTYMLSKEWDSTAGDWVNSSLEVRTVNGADMFTGAEFSEWDEDNGVWEKMAEAEIKYDNNGNLTTLEAFVFIGGFKLPTPIFQSNLYYEYYFNVGVAATPKTQTITVYPNPASSHINVVLNGKQATLQLTNMAGQTVRSIAANGEQVARVNLAGLPAGNYIMTVAGADAAPQRQMITIQ